MVIVLYLGSDDTSMAVVMHEYPQYLGYDLGKVYFEFCTEGSHDLFHQQDNSILHGTIQRPVVL